MSKCREEFEKHTEIPWNYDKDTSLLWQAAWNARGRVDAEICGTYGDNFGKAPDFIAAAIQMEDEK